jgi:hypothetical protein
MSNVLPKRIKIPDDVIWQELGDEVVLLNLGNEHYYELNRVGTRMWQLLAEERDAEAILAQMMNEFDVPEMTLRHDLAQLIGDLQRAHLITTE